MTRVLAAALSLFIAASAALISTVSGLEAKTLGIVALIANDALNVAVIAGATDAAKAAGWDVKVVDTQASADQANAGMSSFAVQKVDAIMVLAFASTSIGSGLAAANAASIPGRELGRRNRARHRRHNQRPDGRRRLGQVSARQGRRQRRHSGDDLPSRQALHRPRRRLRRRRQGQGRPFDHIQRGDRARSGSERQRHRPAVAHRASGRGQKAAGDLGLLGRADAGRRRRASAGGTQTT